MYPQTEQVPCDLCGTTTSIPLHSLRDTWHHVPGEFVLRRCTNCSLMYLSPRPTPASIINYYPADYGPFKPAIEDESWALMRWVRRRKLITRRRLIERYSDRRQGRLLDVGCGTGLFVNEMAQSGWWITGLDPVPSAIEYLRDRLGLNAFQGTLSEFHGNPEFFDVITLWDVLEHTFSPTTELSRAYDLLRDDGLLALSVPNWNSFDRRLFGQHWQGLDPPRHLFTFDERTLRATLGHVGFSVIASICFVPGYFSFAMSLERWLQSRSPEFSRAVGRVLRVPGLRFPLQPWFSFLNLIKRGPIIAVFARKAGSQLPGA